MSSYTTPKANGQDNHSHPPIPPKRLRGKYGTILLSFIALTVPYVVISAVLLGLIFYFQVQQNPESNANLSLSSGLDEGTFIYTNISPTRLARVASLYTTALAYITPFAILLSSYPLALFVLKHSLNQDSWKLLTPYQLNLMLRLIENGGALSILSWLNYMRRPRVTDQRRCQPSPAVGVALTAIFTAILGLLIFAAEWWLHFEIQPYNFNQVTPLGPTEGAYSYTLPPNCLNTNNSYDAQLMTNCSLSPSIKGGYLINPTTAYEVLNNVSSTVSVNIMSSDKQYAFLGTPGNGVPLSQDFSATTYSVLTQCELVTSECGLSDASLTSGITVPFTCSKYPAFTGDLINDEFDVTYFTDSSGTSNYTSTSGVYSNPFYFGVNGYTLTSFGAGIPFQNDPEFVALEFGGLAYLMFCNSTVYDTRYKAINGTISDFEISASNVSVSTLMVQPQANTAAGTIKLDASANLAALSNTDQQFTAIFSLAYSQVLLSLVAGALAQSPAIELQQHSEIIVSAVPKDALYTLVGLSFLFVGFGILLTVIALVAGRNADVEEVRQRLSLKELVVEKFEADNAHEAVDDLDKCFGEFNGQVPKRIGVVGSLGRGWELKDIGESE